jgi:nucleotide-binding universal stress UspA family protein
VYNKIVVPLDGSSLAEVALPYAEEVAGKLGKKITLLSVLPPDDAKQQMSHHRYLQDVTDNTVQQIKKYADNAVKDEVKVEAATRWGNPAEGILSFVRKGHPCLIVMATHGRSGLSRWAIGSVADKIVRASNMQPLLLIRANGAHPDVRARRIFKKVLVPLDGSRESEAVLPHISEIARNLKMEIILLKVIKKANNGYDSTETYLKNCCHRLEQAKIPARYEVKIGSAAEEIIDLADELASDLVAMSTRGQAATSIWPLGSVAQKILLGGNTPLMLIRA